MDARPNIPESLRAWKAQQVSETAAVADRNRWGLALIVVGWSHLVFFLGLQLLYNTGEKRPIFYLSTWAAEFALNLAILRGFAGKGWHRSTPLTSLLVRVWITFLILSFSTASLNSLMTFSVEWYRAAWTTLSTFGFAVTAYLVTPWFFVPAVQMYFTGLLLALVPKIGYAAYGISWWLALQGIGLTLEYRRARRMTSQRPAHGFSKKSGRQHGSGEMKRDPAASDRWPVPVEG